MAEFLGTPVGMFQSGPRTGEGVLCSGWMQACPVHVGVLSDEVRYRASVSAVAQAGT